MRKTSVIGLRPAFLTPAAGIAALSLRYTEINTVFDPVTGLPERRAVITNLLIALCLVYLAHCLVYSLIAAKKCRLTDSFTDNLGIVTAAYPLAFCAAGFAWLGATAVYFVNARQSGAIALSELLFSALSALSAVSVMLMSTELYKDPNRKARYILSVIPALFMCYWLVLLYKQNASNPVLLSYCYQCLAIIFAALGFYFTSGFVFGKPARSKALFSYLAAVYFCIMAAADAMPVSVRIIFVSIAAVNLISAILLLRGLQNISPPPSETE